MVTFSLMVLIQSLLHVLFTDFEPALIARLYNETSVRFLLWTYSDHRHTQCLNYCLKHQESETLLPAPK